MKEIIEQIAAANGWGFEYGRKDFLNLFNEVEDKSKVYIFLEPSVIEDNDNDTGLTESQTFSGFMTVVYSSDIDEESYEARYENYIKPIVSEAVKTLKEEIRCGQDVTFTQWKKTEVINIFDYNLDGVIITYNLTIDED